MSIDAYLAELELHLRGLNEEDKQNSLAYYNEYLIDACADTSTDIDPQTILGNPRTLAAQIKADFAVAPLTGEEPFATASGLGSNKQTQSTTQHDMPQQDTYRQSVPQQNTAQQSAGYTTGTYTAAQNYQPKARKSESSLHTVLTVVLAIFAIPIGVPLAIALVAVVFSILVTLFALLISLGACVVALLIVGLASGIVGIILLFINFAVGIFYVGTGLVSLGLAILLGLAFKELGKLLINGVTKLFNSIRGRLNKKGKVTS